MMLERPLIHFLRVSGNLQLCDHWFNQFRYECIELTINLGGVLNLDRGYPGQAVDFEVRGRN